MNTRLKKTLSAAPLAGLVLGFAPATTPGAAPLVDSTEIADSPLVADAGDSDVVKAGQQVVLLGTSFGGDGERRTFAWSTEAGGVEDVDNPTGVIDTTDVEPGRYTATLTVTDAAGDAATDTVLFEVTGDAATGTEVLNETVADGSPGTFATGSTRDFTFTVEPGTARLETAIAWTVPANDYDLTILDPNGAEAGSSGSAPPATSEATGVANPMPGEWTLQAVRYATAGEPELTATVEAFGATAGDTRPEVDAGGPYAFDATATQTLDGTVVGGTAPVTSGWDTDLDGVIDAEGEDVTVSLVPGRHLVTFKVTDGNGFERREMTSVVVGDQALRDELASPVTVIGIADSGINPYHQEFSAATYPDPEVLELTRNFTRHPSEYIPGYPADNPALPISLGEGYFPAGDTHLWEGNDYVKPGQMYWIPGTKIIGAVDAGGSTGATSGDDLHPILDDNGHGTGSASVAAGNRYGYCPTCLIVMTEALDESVAAKHDWIDISSNSFGYVGGLPIGYAVGASEVTKTAAERGQTTLFAAGNGTGNAFATTPVLTYGSDQTGPDWNITVGALREDNQEAIISDGLPAHISALGDGDLPSACRTGDTGQCAFGGTSAATPYTAGVFGSTLTRIRDVLGDTEVGQREGQVIAEGTPVAGSPYLEDGKLTRRELRAAVLKTAVPRNESADFTDSYPYPWTYAGPESVIFEGYGAAGPLVTERAVEVLLGQRELPLREDADAFFAEDCRLRDDQYGSYDRDGDGEADDCSASIVEAFVGTGEATNDDPTVGHYDPARAAVADGPVLTEPITYWLHRRNVQEPTVADGGCAEDFSESFLTRIDSAGDLEPCVDSRITSTVAAFRPKGIFAAKDVVEGAIPAGSTVDVTAFVTTEASPTAQLTANLKATDRLVGRSETETVRTQPSGPGAAACGSLGGACWTEVTFSFTTDRNVAAGEQLSFHFQLAGAQAWAYGYEGDHASSFTITPAPAGEGLDFGVTVDDPTDGVLSGKVAFPDLGEDPQGAGFHPSVHRVQVSVGDDAFRDPVYATIDPETGTWSAFVGEARGDVFVRALRDRFPSAVEETRINGRSGDAPGRNR